MGENFSKELIIDERFQRLTYPLDVQSLAHLETSILSGLCNKSLVVWNGYLIDGFGHYSGGLPTAKLFVFYMKW